MGISKVIYGDRTLIDLTNDTVSPESLLLGETAHDASGELIVGTATGGGSNKILKNQTLTFDNNLTATITDSSFTATSDYAVLYYNPSYAEQAKITTESSSGTLTFTAETTPENTIVCDVVIFLNSSSPISPSIPEAPTIDGTYVLKATVVNGVATYAWIADKNVSMQKITSLGGHKNRVSENIVIEPIQ